MANTTISVSKKFQSWLKGKGKKGESYEDIIKKMLKPEALKELESYKPTEDVEEIKEKVDSKPDIIDAMFEGKLT